MDTHISRYEVVLINRSVYFSMASISQEVFFLPLGQNNTSRLDESGESSKSNLEREQKY